VLEAPSAVQGCSDLAWAPAHQALRSADEFRRRMSARESAHVVEEAAEGEIAAGERARPKVDSLHVHHIVEHDAGFQIYYPVQVLVDFFGVPESFRVHTTM